MIRAILFDFDDTLGNREAYAYEAYRAILKKYCGNIDPILFEAMLQDCMIRDEHGNYDKNEVVKMLEKDYGVILPIENFPAYWAEHLAQFTCPMDDAQEVLDELSGRFQLGIITNGIPAEQREKLRRSGLLQYFDDRHIVISGEVGMKKPDPAIFRLAAERMGVPCEECAFVGDLFGRDILGAHRAGMTPVWIWSSEKRKCEADVLRIASLKELCDLFREGSDLL